MKAQFAGAGRSCLVAIIARALLLAGCGTRTDALTPASPAAAPPAAGGPTPTLAPVVIGTLHPTGTMTAVPGPISTLAATRTSTSTNVAIQTPVLQSLANGSSASDFTTFRWSWDGPALASNQGFEVRRWKEGQADHFVAGDPVRITSVAVDLDQAAGVRQGGPGTYLWTVTVAGSLAYVADESSGLQIMDVSNPANPVRRAGYKTPGYANGVMLAGSLAYVADGESELAILQWRPASLTGARWAEFWSNESLSDAPESACYGCENREARTAGRRQALCCDRRRSITWRTDRAWSSETDH